MSARGSNLGQRIAVGVVGTLLTLAMLFLGLWQMQVFQDQGSRDAARRSTATPVELVPLIPPDGSVGDVYGRNVHVRGHYRADESTTVVDADGTRRSVTALILPDGRALPVVRGASTGVAPVAPTGDVDLTGVFLPSEAADTGRTVKADEITSVRLPVIQQRWSEQLAPGFVTLNAAEATREGLSPATVTLPSQDGRVRNFGYALQWWVFAAFAVIMTIVWIRTLARRAATISHSDDPEAPQASVGSSAGGTT